MIEPRPGRTVTGMQVGQPSRTAMATAQSRAYHQLADEPRIFTDPLAVRIVGEEAARDNPFDKGVDPELARRRRLFLATRSRFADDTVAEAVAGGTRQVVVLGAGMDTAAYRNPHPDVRFFEVDHPDTQAWKRNRLSEAGIEVPHSMTFAPVDFHRDDLADALAQAGLDRARSAVYVWLGVVVYLEHDAIAETLRYIAGQGGGADLVFDYSYPPDAGQQARGKRVAAVGEPWVSFFTEEQMRSELESAGFTDIEDHSGIALVRSYADLPADGPALPGPHLVRARTAVND
ncbi:class I SAM-dependent methyltransferase [Nocardia aobensis]|uniref:class I SAM-dependent methyltransferase n=1 Tax=Nocardia aobensis TaxID=257277 RepID=UPI001FE13398|nr:class I SAM-dependent methyltransferase [Nocardia aobensis]